MAINKLKPYFNDEVLDSSFNKQQLDELYEVFKQDFVFDPFTVDGKKIKIIHSKSIITQYSDYSETFAHIVSRETYTYNARLYECKRANRIHWIKPILLAHPAKDIFYYRYNDKGACRHHYWYFEKDFMVVTQDIKPDLRIVTAFCVDADQKKRFYERYSDFKDGLDCL